MNTASVTQANARRNHRVPLIQIILERIPFYANALVALAGVAVLAEWMAGTLRIARISEQFVPMAPATALCFVALGLGSLFHRRNANQARLRAVAQGTAIFALGVSALILVEHSIANVSEIRLDIEQWLTPAMDSAQGLVVGRMSPLTASMFILIALAYLLALTARGSDRRHHSAQALAVATLAGASVFVVSYLYGAPLLYDTRLIPVALPTALSFAVLGLGLLFEQPKGILLRMFTSSSFSAQLARIAVPGSIGLILSGGWLNVIVWSQTRGEDRIFGVALVALTTAGLVALLIVLTARQIQSEAMRYKLFAEHSRDIVLFVRYADGRILEANRAALDAYGFTRDELLTKTIRDLRPPNDQANVYPQMNVANTKGILFEAVHIRKDGSEFPVEVSSRGATVGGQRVLLSIVRDISERKRAERALIESHNLNESLLQTIPFGMDIVDQAGTILFANEKLHALVGVDLRAHTCWQMYKDDQTQCADCSLKQPIAPGETRIIETAGVLGGKIFAIHHTGMIYQGKPAILEVFQEITETKRAEQILRDSEERYRLLFHEMLDGFALHEIICDADGAPVDYRFLEANPAFERLTGLRAAAIIGKTVREVIPGIEPEWIAKYGRVALTGEPIQFENYASALGKYYHVTAFSPRVGQFAVIFEDVTQRQVAEERTNQLGQILEESLNEIYIFDAQTLRFIQVNRGARENLGYSMGELRELTPLDLKPEFTPAIFAAHLEPLRTHEREQIQFTTIHRRKNGTTYPVEVSLQLANLGSVPVFVAIILDITARQQRERELEAIASISAALRAAHARAEMLPIILDQVAGLIPLEGAAIGLLNELTGDLIIEQARGVWAAAIGRRTPSDQGITHQVLSTGKPYVTTDLPNDPLMYWRDLIQTANAMATVPLATQNAVIGWIGIGAKHNFSETDLRVLTAIADIAANAIRRSALHEQTKRHLDRITALGIIDRAINASLDLRIVLNILLDQAVTHLRADAAAMLLFNRAAQTLEWRAERGMRASHLTAVPVRLGGDATSRAILERRALHIPDLGMHSDAPARAALLASEEFVSYYAVPLIAKGVVKGVLEIFHRAPHIGDAEWEGFMQSLAEQAAIALDNAELFNGLERANDELVMAYDATIEGWSRALDLRDKETEGHSQRVTEMTIRLARALNIPDSQLTLIRRGALLHDIGKMGIPDAILLKPGPLSEKEWEIMRLHPAYAHELLSGISYLGNALDIPYCHHEKWDGTGYPRGLAGETIPVAARIFALADVWDALSSERPYRAAWPPDRVIAYIREQPGKHFDPAVVAAFLNLTRGE